MEDKNIDELFPDINKGQTDSKKKENEFNHLHPDIQKLKIKHQTLQTNATMTRELEVVE